MKSMGRLLKLAGVLMVLAGFSACEPSESRDSARRKRMPEMIDQAPSVVEFAKTALEQAQSASISDNVEYCGYVVLSPEGALKIIGPARGSSFGCKTPLVYKPDVILASFHTHGAFDPSALTEIPSSIDFESVAAERIDAFVGTPGGRFWHIDFEKGLARLQCGPKNCLSSQKNGTRQPDHQIPTTLTLKQVLEIEQKAAKPNRR